MPNNNGDITFKYGTQEAYNGLSSIDENAIYITTDTHRIYIGGADYTDDTQMNNVTKQYIDNIASTVNSRVDNIIANSSDTEGNSELIDIRTGADNTVYESAGSAVRNQINVLKKELNKQIMPSDISYLRTETIDITNMASKNYIGGYIAEYFTDEDNLQKYLLVPTGGNHILMEYLVDFNNDLYIDIPLTTEKYDGKVLILTDENHNRYNFYSSSTLSTITDDWLTYNSEDNSVRLNIKKYKDFRPRFTKLYIEYIDYFEHPTLTHYISIKPNHFQWLDLPEKELSLILNNVICIGDSLTEGDIGQGNNSETVINRVLSHNYPYYLKRIINEEVTNAGIMGRTAASWWYWTNKGGLDVEQDIGTGQIVHRFIPSSFSKYNTAIIWLGTNEGLDNTLETDVLPYNDYTEFLNTNTGCYCKIISKILSDNPDCNIFLMPVIGLNETYKITNNVIKKIAKLYNIDIINIDVEEWETLKNNKIYHPNDSVHFSNYGYLKIANAIVESITESIKNNPQKYIDKSS